MAIAVVALGVGLIPVNPSIATVMVLVAFTIMAAGLAVGGRVRFQPGERLLRRTLGAGILVEGIVLASLPVLENGTYQIALVVLCLVAFHATLFADRFRRVEIAFVLLGHFVLMCWMLAATAVPPIDVIPFQQDSAAALLRGVNPYGITFENIFGPGSPYYAPEMQVGDRLAFGFMYPPLSLILALPGYLIFGDYRYGAVAAVTLTAGLVAWTSPSRVAAGAAMLIVLAPVTQVVLYWGWTEPFVALMVAATVFLATARPATSPIALGLLVASKQYCAPVLLIGYALLRAVRIHVGPVRMLLVPTTVAALTVLPFAIWDLPALVHSTITMQILQPLRIDALTIPAQLARAGEAPTPPILGFVLGGLTLVLLIAWSRRTVAGFCYATAAFFMVFFLFNKHAFVNYYFFVMVAVACGIAVSRHHSLPGQVGQAPGSGSAGTAAPGTA